MMRYAWAAGSTALNCNLRLSCSATASTDKHTKGWNLISRSLWKKKTLRLSHRLMQSNSDLCFPTLFTPEIWKKENISSCVRIVKKKTQTAFWKGTNTGSQAKQQRSWRKAFSPCYNLQSVYSSSVVFSRPSEKTAVCTSLTRWMS